ELASASFDNTVRIWDPATGKELRRLKGEFVEPHTVAFVNGGKQIVTAQGWYPSGMPNPVQLWAAVRGEIDRNLVKRGPRYYLPLAFSPDGKTFASGLVDSVMLIPCAEGGRSGTLPDGGGRRYRHLAFSPDGSRLLVCASGDVVDNTPPTEPFGVRLF